MKRSLAGVVLLLAFLGSGVSAQEEKPPAATEHLLEGEVKNLRFVDRSHPQPFRPVRIGIHLAAERPEGAPAAPADFLGPLYCVRPFGGRPLTLVLGREGEEKHPTAFAADLDRDGSFGDGERWRIRPQERRTPLGGTFVVGMLGYLRVAVGERKLPIAFSYSLRPDRPIRAQLTPLYYLKAALALGEERFLLSVLDGDADGAFDGPEDRWLVEVEGERERAAVALALSTWDESRFLAGRRFRLAVKEGSKLAVRVEPAEGPDPGSLARHRERVARTWAERFANEGDRFEKAKGLDPSRPRAATPVAWRDTTFAAARLEAARTGKPLFVALMPFWAHVCWRMEHFVYADREVADLLNASFVPVRIIEEQDLAGDTSRLRPKLGRENPVMGVFAANGDLLKAFQGFRKPEQLAEELRAALE